MYIFQKKKYLYPIAIIIVVFFVIPIIWGKNNLPPRVSIGNFILKGPNDQAEKQIVNDCQQFNKKEITFLFNNSKGSGTVEEIGFNIDPGKTFDNLKPILEFNSLSLRAYFKWWGNLAWGYKVPIYYTFDSEKLNNFLQNKFNVNLNGSQEASLKINGDKVDLIPSKEGMGVDGSLVAAQVLDNIRKWQDNTIQVGLVHEEPDVTTDEAKKLQDEINRLLAYPFVFKALGYTVNLQKSVLLSWIDIKKVERPDVQSSETDNLKNSTNFNLTGQNLSDSKKNYVLEWGVNQDAIRAFLKQEIEGVVYRQAVNGVLAFENGEIKETQPSQSEVTVDMDKAVGIVTDSFKKGENFINLPIKETPAPISLKKVNELGINTLIGVGNSNFTGSPVNRRHNISVGSSKFNGVVINQGDEFSFLTTLGPVNKETGYLPELVIKVDKTVPEYGGGMCQVSSTAFRAAVNSGLRITERQNHAYPVKYYDPQGTDATVYIPHPDLKFVNDTPGPILVQTKLEGNSLTFEYYGKSDGRTVTLEGPRTWDKKPDGSMKAAWVQNVYDTNGKLMWRKEFLSKYDSPSKYPHPGDEKPPTDNGGKKKKKH